MDSVSCLHLPCKIRSLVELELVVELLGLNIDKLVSSDITSDISELSPGESRLRPL